MQTEEHIEEVLKQEAEEGSKKLLFTTKTCPNCAIAKRALEEAHMDYEVVDAQENKDLVKKYGVMQAPTLIVVEDGKVQKLANAPTSRSSRKRMSRL